MFIILLGTPYASFLPCQNGSPISSEAERTGFPPRQGGWLFPNLNWKLVLGAEHSDATPGNSCPVPRWARHYELPGALPPVCLTRLFLASVA